jgi:hypothetical protein
MGLSETPPVALGPLPATTSSCSAGPIPEIYPGIEEEAVRVGADVYSLYAVNDAIAHEYEFGEGDHMASSRTPLDWLRYQVGMASFRAFAEGKATWILNYSWDGDKKVDPREAMQNLFMSELMAGASVWDARGHVMSGSNDIDTRKQVFGWIAEHEATFYRSRQPIHPIGVYFSPATRNYFSSEFSRSYQGVLILLMQKHLEYAIVTPRTLAGFKGSALILPDVRMLDEDERAKLRQFAELGGKLIVTGEDATRSPPRSQVARFPTCPGKAYMESLERDFAGANPTVEARFLETLPAADEVQIDAPPNIATHIARVDGRLQVFFANFTGLRGGENARPQPQPGVRVTVHGKGTAEVLPFLGDVQSLKGEARGSATVFELPPISRGAVFSFRPLE